MTASLKESVEPPAEDLHPQEESAPYSKRDEDFVRILNAAGLACELDTRQLSGIAIDLEESRVDSRRMDILGAVLSRQRRCVGRVAPPQQRPVLHAQRLLFGECASARLVLGEPQSRDRAVKLQRIGTDEGPLVLRAGEHFSAVTDEDDEDAEGGTVAVRALVRALNSLLAKAEVSERLVPLVPDESRELYVGVTEEGAMTLLQGGCTELSAVAALREFASW